MAAEAINVIPSSLSGCGDGETEELRDELTALIADQQYHEFIDDVVLNKKVADNVSDNDYDPMEEVGHDSDDHADNKTAPKRGEQVEDQEIASSSDSSGSEDDDIDDVEDNVGHEAAGEPIKIPMEMLTEAEKRFPPFWRTKQALKNLETGSYKSEDDLDYDLANDENASKEAETKDMEEGEEYREAKDEDLQTQSESESDDEEVAEAVPAQEIEELKRDSESPIQPDVKYLVEMLEMMTLPPEYPEPEEVEDSDSESLEEDNVDEKSETIATFDAEGYNSAEDPDFVAELKEEDGSSSSSDESSEEIERVE